MRLSVRDGADLLRSAGGLLFAVGALVLDERMATKGRGMAGAVPAAGR
jgi:hypothetical protein